MVDQTLIADIQALKAKGYAQTDIDTAYNYVAPAAAVQGFEFGFNLGGTWISQSAINDPIVPLTDIAANYPNAKYIRAWLTSDITQTPPPTQWITTVKWAAAGYKVIAVWNTNNNSVARGAMPTAAQIAAYFGALPTASETGVWAIELVNEHDYLAYYNGTVAQLAQLFTIAGPILRSKGYKVIGSNCLNSWGWYTNSTIKNVIKSVDYIGRHAYEATAAAALADYDKVKVTADQFGVGYCCTEVGLHNANTLTELPKLWNGLKQRNGIYIAFPFYSVAGNPPGNINRLYDFPGNQNPNNAVIKPILGA